MIFYSLLIIIFKKNKLIIQKKINKKLSIFFLLAAYKQADGKKIDERRIIVDCERGRTVKGWKPRRFGGGKGESRRTKSQPKEKAAKK